MNRLGLRFRRAALLASILATFFCVPCTPCQSDPPEEGGYGELLWKGPGGPIALPIVSTNVELSATGMMVRGTVFQEFQNSTGEVIEAVYVFPLPEGAAVDGMEMKIGERRIVAVVQEREEAKATYERAKSERKKSSLVEQARPNLFKSAVANINPGERVLVKLQYLEQLAYLDGTFSLTFPLTYTPRYAPPSVRDSSKACIGRTPAPSGAAVPSDAERTWTANECAATAEPVSVDASVALAKPKSEAPSVGAEVPDSGFVAEGSPLTPRASVHVRIDAGVPIESVSSPSHAILTRIQGSTAQIDLEAAPVPADRDFVVRWKPRLSDAPSGALFTEERGGERYALAMLVPPIPDSDAAQGLATQTIFIVDVSGSMEGASLQQARESLLAALDRLRPGDSFNLMKFSDGNSTFREGFLPSDSGSIEEARAWVRALHTEGGTQILPALVRGMKMMESGDSRKVQRLILVTDGAVENEEQVFTELQQHLRDTRLHVIGIGSAPNRFFMRKIAGFGRGLCEFIGSSQEVGVRMAAFLGRLDRPVMTDVSIDWEGAFPLEIYPAKLPDLYAGEPLFVSLRLAPGTRAERAALTGRVAGGLVRSEFKAGAEASEGSGVATRWARAKVESLIDGLGEGADPTTVRLDVIGLAKTFNLVTRFTSLVAVEEVPTAEGTARTAGVASAMPHGSGLLGAELPQTGTLDSLFMIIGVLLALVGGAIALATRTLS